MDKIKYSFDDEVVNIFCCDLDNKKIELHFSGFFDLDQNKYVNKKSVWIIRQWDYANSKLSSDDKYTDFEKHLGLISMILFIKINDDTLVLTVNTIDNRYVDLLFSNPYLDLIQLND